MNDFLRHIILWGKDLVNVILPDVCSVCHTTLVDGEDIMCLKCLMGLPQTGLHIHQPNLIHERLISLSSPIQRASSLFWYYKDNEYSSLIHDAKYNGRPSIALKLARMHSTELQKTDFFDGIDLILPVPMHFYKRMIRGYNQAFEIAKGISDITGIPVCENLRARRMHTTQTKKNLSQRLASIKGVYKVVHPEELDGKHVLIVDDVITTGATMVECIDTIHRHSPTASFSVFSLALTHLR